MASSTVENRAARKADSDTSNESNQSECESEMSVLKDAQCYARQYIQQQPETAALICIGVGFLLGWKLKPW